MDRVDEKILSIGGGRRSVILNFIMLKFYIVYPYLELHILFYCNGLAIWSAFSDISHIKKKMAGIINRHDLVSVRILTNFELIRAISEVDIWYKF